MHVLLKLLVSVKFVVSASTERLVVACVRIGRGFLWQLLVRVSFLVSIFRVMLRPPSGCIEVLEHCEAQPLSAEWCPWWKCVHQGFVFLVYAFGS